ncbi:copper amine oxidase N-terminal domain-containing protein [Paenibacillus sp. N4]|uniref:copper amine oxidase N-terminal domain-containing protein n=1 Tax=Paenibacillus vietnamensis TaxID=2590547 RepID=UPI001CD132A4|nr:copper amine oxidase N-terminal domain-containing protein [Paenibacillus vietnamensis]MCA0756560.1 copper amine oxidase N-terminal domain-containing protein [Paenibacillus vietnamensis]
MARFFQLFNKKKTAPAAKSSLAFLLAAVLFLVAPSAALAAETAVSASSQAEIRTKEQAAALAREFSLMPEGAVIEEVKRQAVPYDCWRVAFVGPDRDREGRVINFGEILLQAKDGALAGFSAHYWTKDRDITWIYGPEFDLSKQKVDKVQAAAIAEAFIKGLPWELDAEWMPNPYPESEYRTRADDKSLHKINFDRSVNGIRVHSQRFSVFVDRITGEVASYEVYWGKMDFPAPNHLLSREEAALTLVRQVNPYLQMTEFGDQHEPAYALQPLYSLDAVTGELPADRNPPAPESGYKGKPALRISKEYAKLLLLSQYDLELQYQYLSATKAGLYYRLVVKPDVPLFYTGAPPALNAVTGKWTFIYQDSAPESLPGPGDWLADAVSSPESIDYPAAVVLNDRLLPLQSDPVILKGTVLVPFRELLQKELNASITWDAAAKKVTAKSKDTRLELTAGSRTAYVNGKPYALGVPVQLINGRVYIPVRFAAQALGAKVEWISSSRLVLIRTGPETAEQPSEARLKQLRWEAQLNWTARRYGVQK